MKDLMSFLNQLGANVRNHMSPIEDKFVEDARQAFPVAQKQSRLSFLNPNETETAKKDELKKETPAEKTIQQKPVAAQPTVPAKAAAPVKTATAETPGNEVRNQTEMPHQPVARPQPARPETQGVVPSAADKRSPNRVNPPVGNRTGNSGAAPVRNNFQTDRPKPTEGSRPGMGSQGPNNRPFNNTNSVNRPAATGGYNSGGQSGAAARPGANRPGPGSNAGGNRPGGGSYAGNNRPGGGSYAGNNRPGGGSYNNRPGAGSRPGGNRPGMGSNAGGNRRSQPGRPGQYQNSRSAKPQGPATNVKSVKLPASMAIKDFAQLIEVAAGDVIKKLMGLGLMASINQEIDMDTMTLIADEYKITVTAALTEEQKLQVEEIDDDPASLLTRPPIVTILGHVDHGKTSLLDAIRETNVIAQEAGGITQHIGAYQVELKDRKITFLDTPGHAAFTAMRARGAQVTDIAILVVAADDGVMPQTIEAVNHAKDANVAIIVAINKMDKPGADPERIKQGLTEYGLVAEEWGGETIFVPVSAKKREGIENLLEMILLVADLKDFKANPNRPAKGTVVEAELDKGRGPVATVLVQNGTLQIGDSIIAGAAAGKVKVLYNDKGKRVKKAGPAMPVAVIGFDEVPAAGDTMYVITEDRLARELADRRLQFKRESELKRGQKVTLDDLFTRIKEGEIKDLKVIIKADVQGSVEAIRQSLEQLSNEEVRVKAIHAGVGGIGEGDIMLASASNAIIVGFNVRPDPMAKRLAEMENVDVRLYRVIYNIIEDVQKAMEGMLAPEYKEVILGRAEIRLVYKVPKAGNVGGCFVTEGKITRNNDIRLIRDNIVVHEGKIDSLKRFKDDVREVAEGFECGIGIEKFNDIKEGDIIEVYTMEEIKRNLTK